MLSQPREYMPDPLGFSIRRLRQRAAERLFFGYLACAVFWSGAVIMLVSTPSDFTRSATFLAVKYGGALLVALFTWLVVQRWLNRQALADLTRHFLKVLTNRQLLRSILRHSAPTEDPADLREASARELLVRTVDPEQLGQHRQGVTQLIYYLPHLCHGAGCPTWPPNWRLVHRLSLLPVLLLGVAVAVQLALIMQAGDVEILEQSSRGPSPWSHHGSAWWFICLGVLPAMALRVYLNAAYHAAQESALATALTTSD